MVCGLSQVSLANCNKVLALRGKKRLVADCFCCATETCQLIYPHKFEVCKCAPTKNFTSHLYCLTSKVNLVGADPNLRGYTNYLPVTRETTKLVSSDQMRSSHCS